MNGFLNLDKPVGFTSHDCVAKVRRILNLKRVGHAGTLDPAATGVLPIALGKATRLLQFLRQDKAYQATVRFGVSTSTNDLEGEVLFAEPCPGLDLETVKLALQPFLGCIQQVPPIYSAIQVGGKRLYDLARAGQEVVVPSRQVEVFDLQVLDWRAGEFPEVDLAIACGPGTYIRAIARDLGQALKTGGTLACLSRTASSGFYLNDSMTLETLATEVEQGRFQPVLPEIALSHLPVLVLPDAIARRWCQGQRVLLEEVQKQGDWQDRQIAGASAAAGADEVEKADETEEADGVTLQVALQIRREDGCFLGIGHLSQAEAGIILVPQVVFEGG